MTASGTNRTKRAGLMMSVDRGRLEVKKAKPARLTLNGQCTPSTKGSEALDFLFVVETQKC
jgi:hypothetical protein